MPDFGYVSGFGKRSSLYTASPTNASAHTKGSWLDLVTSTPFQASGFWLQLISGPTNARYLVDIGAGATPQAIVPNLGFALRSSSTGNYYTEQLYFNCAIPSGSKISVRMQSSNASDSLTAVCTLVADPLVGNSDIQKYFDMGTDTANTAATSITVPASGISAYVQITAATPYRMKHMRAMFMFYGMSTDTDWTTEFAVGAGGSETIFARCKNLFRPSSVDGIGPLFAQFPVDIPAGSRLAVRTVFGGGGGGTIAIPVMGGY